MNSPEKLDAIPAQFKPSLFYDKVPMYPVLLTFVTSTFNLSRPRAALSRSGTNCGVVRGLWNTFSPTGRVLLDT